MWLHNQAPHAIGYIIQNVDALRDRQWFRVMTGLLIASGEPACIRPWLRKFAERIMEKLATGARVQRTVSMALDRVLPFASVAPHV